MIHALAAIVQTGGFQYRFTGHHWLAPNSQPSTVISTWYDKEWGYRVFDFTRGAVASKMSHVSTGGGALSWLHGQWLPRTQIVL